MPDLKQKKRRQSREIRTLKTKFTSKGPSLIGSVQKLKDASKFSRIKLVNLIRAEPAYTICQSVHRKTTRLKKIVYCVDEIWSIDLAYVDKVSQNIKDMRYIFVAVDCMSHYLRVEH